MSNQQELETKVITYLIIVAWLASTKVTCTRRSTFTEIKLTTILIWGSSFHFWRCWRSNSAAILILRDHWFKGGKIAKNVNKSHGWAITPQSFWLIEEVIGARIFWLIVVNSFVCLFILKILTIFKQII